MAKLYPRMFSADAIKRDTTFGLRSGQIVPKDHRVAHKADWYSRSGEWLGCGDLSAADMKHISFHLQDDDIFVIVNEQHQGDFAVTRPLDWRKSQGFLGRRCHIIIKQGRFFYVNDFLAEKKRQGFLPLNGCMFVVITHVMAKSILQGQPAFWSKEHAAVS